MNIIKRYYYKIIYRFSNRIRVDIARKIGVNFTEEKEDCRILTDPLSLFGTEPYLITVGKHVCFTYGVRLITHDGGVWCLRENKGYSNVDSFAPIKIGNNCFFGSNVIVLPGVNIGDNCIIGAGSIVTKSIESNSVVAGIPAKIIKKIDEYESSTKTKRVMTKNIKNKELFLRQKFPEWFK